MTNVSYKNNLNKYQLKKLTLVKKILPTFIQKLFMLLMPFNQV